MGPLRPFPKQTAFLLLDDFEALYGGAAGGAKTAALMIGALQYIDVPGYSGILLRRTYPQLAASKGIIRTLKLWCRPFLERKEMHWDGANNILTATGGGALKISHLQHDKSVDDHQGQEYQYVGMDELTQFTEYQADEMISRLRRGASSHVPLRFRAASNPHRQGRGWVKDRYVTGNKGAFIPARMEDNPHLDQGYRDTINRLDPVRQKQLGDGDWDAAAMAGQYKEEWWPIVDSMPQVTRKVRTWDLAATAVEEGKDPDATASTLGGRTASGLFSFDPHEFRGDPADVEAHIRHYAELDGKDVPIWIEIEPGASGKSIVSHYRRNVLAGWEVHGEPKRKNTELLIGPLAAAAKNGECSIVRSDHAKVFLRDQWAMFPDGDHDDMLVSMILAHEKLCTGSSADNWARAYKTIAARRAGA